MRILNSCNSFFDNDDNILQDVMKVSKEDFPEELKDNIKYIAEHGTSYFMLNSDKSELETRRKKAIEAIKYYREYKVRMKESTESQNKYKELAKKLGL